MKNLILACSMILVLSGRAVALTASVVHDYVIPGNTVVLVTGITDDECDSVQWWGSYYPDGRWAEISWDLTCLCDDDPSRECVGESQWTGPDGMTWTDRKLASTTASFFRKHKSFCRFVGC